VKSFASRCICVKGKSTDAIAQQLFRAVLHDSARCCRSCKLTWATDPPSAAVLYSSHLPRCAVGARTQALCWPPDCHRENAATPALSALSFTVIPLYGGRRASIIEWRVLYCIAFERKRYCVCASTMEYMCVPPQRALEHASVVRADLRLPLSKLEHARELGCKEMCNSYHK